MKYEDLKAYLMIKIARDMPSFTKQDRPKKVKEIYRALKRDHPEMTAEMKARIAARQGKKGKQKQGPPYKGPLTKAAGKGKTCFWRNGKRMCYYPDPAKWKPRPLKKKKDSVNSFTRDKLRE